MRLAGEEEFESPGNSDRNEVGSLPDGKNMVFGLKEGSGGRRVLSQFLQDFTRSYVHTSSIRYEPTTAF